MRWTLLILTMLMGWATAAAQDSLQTERLRTEMQKADILQTDTVKKQHEIGIIRETIRGFDRTEDDYIEPQHYEFTVMGQVTRTYENFVLSSNGQSIRLAPDRQTKVGPYFGWRWFFFGYMFDIKNIGFSQNGLRKSFDLSIYSSQVGVDIFYRRTGDDYKIRDVDLDGVDGRLFEGMPFAGVNVGITGVSAYYIFNHGRFSYPAAFSQSTCQKISCGSWLAGAGYTHNTLDMDYEELEKALNSRMSGGQELKLDSGMMFKDIQYNDFIISGGYAYNWVFARNWLLGGSIQLAASHKRSTGEMSEGKSRGFSIRNMYLDGIGRFALVYNNMKWYAGCSMVIHTYNYNLSRFSTNNTFGSANLYVGINFGLKKKYKEKK